MSTKAKYFGYIAIIIAFILGGFLGYHYFYNYFTKDVVGEITEFYELISMVMAFLMAVLSMKVCGLVFQIYSMFGSSCEKNSSSA